MSHTTLLEEIDALFSADAATLGASARDTFERFLDALEGGHIRAAQRRDDGEWVVNPVKRGICWVFGLGRNVEFAACHLFSDKDTYLIQQLLVVERNIRIVPGGNSVRRGSYIGRNVVMMPPAFINVGAYVGDGTIVDSHALVGSCAQVGTHVHISAGVQIGGVLEPIGQTPVIIEDGVMLGGNCGVYEGVRVRQGAVLASGCVVTASTPVFDLVNETVLRATPEAPLEIPKNAVVVPGTRPAKGEFAAKHGLQMAALLIVKYRDEKTDARTALEELLR
ncbi:MAG: 2,3,4,5-tetrahydropyridine-2,6-dicarboxylate N-succinyltransferase [bacterium]